MHTRADRKHSYQRNTLLLAWPALLQGLYNTCIVAVAVAVSGRCSANPLSLSSTISCMRRRCIAGAPLGALVRPWCLARKNAVAIMYKKGQCYHDMFGLVRAVVPVKHSERWMLVRSFCAWPRCLETPTARRVNSSSVSITPKQSITQHIYNRIAPNAFTNMDEPPRKRRKTSSPAQITSSPLRKPPRRPSSASPTKASLARNYPNLLPTRTPPHGDVRSRGEQARRRALDRVSTPPKEVEKRAEDEAELRSSPPQRGLEDQERPRRGIILSSPSKGSPRPKGALRRSPLALAPADHRNQLNRPTDDALGADGQTEKVKRPPLDPEVEKRRQEKARLQREIEELEAQVSRCTIEIAAGQQRDTNDALLPTQRADLM